MQAEGWLIGRFKEISNFLIYLVVCGLKVEAGVASIPCKPLSLSYILGIFSSKDLFSLTFVCMSVLLTCVYLYHVHAWC